MARSWSFGCLTGNSSDGLFECHKVSRAVVHVSVSYGNIKSASGFKGLEFRYFYIIYKLFKLIKVSFYPQVKWSRFLLCMYGLVFLA